VTRSALAVALLLACVAAGAAEVVPVKWPNPSVAWANTTWSEDVDTHGQPNLRPGRWNVVDLRAHAPEGATHAGMKGILVITHGTAAAQCEIVVWWRRPGEFGSAGAYVSQTVSVVPGGGVRTPDSVLVPLRDGMAEMWWEGNPAGQAPHPIGCAFGFTYRPQWFVL